MARTTSKAIAHLLANLHPGEILLADFLQPMALSQTALARQKDFLFRSFLEIRDL